jgi:hypothetical protein
LVNLALFNELIQGVYFPSILLPSEQTTMLRRHLSILVGLLLIVLMAACTPETTMNDSVAADDNPSIEGDSSADSPNQNRSEPPPATLTIDGWEQTAGITSYCWKRGDDTGLCADGIGVTTNQDPIPAGSTFLAEFELLMEAPPGRVQISIFPASQPVAEAPEGSDWSYWRPVPGDQFTLPPSSTPSIELTLEPGLHVFHLFVGWPDHGDASYGFLVDVEGALQRDSAAFAADQGLALEETMQRLQFQETIGDIQPLLMADLPDTYGGLWVEQQPEYRIVIALTEGDIETIHPYLAGREWADFVEVRPVNYTLEELRADQAIASQAANSVKVAAITTVDIVNNRVELIIGNPGLFLSDLAQAGIELPETVVVLANDPEGELPDTNRGVLLEVIASDERIIHLPVQPPSGASMMALMEGTLVEVDGCLRIEDGHYTNGWLVLWPFGSDIRVGGDRVEVINEDGQPVARVGDRTRAGGGAVENSRGMAGLDEMIPGMPIDGCPGPYWVSAPLETMVEQTVPDITFQPFSSGDQILAWLVSQSMPSPETEILSGELVLDEEGCLRLEEYLLIMPPETYLRENPLRIADRGRDQIAQIGDLIRVTGAEKVADDYRYFDNKVRCSGPYWGANQISAAE